MSRISHRCRKTPFKLALLKGNHRPGKPPHPLGSEYAKAGQKCKKEQNNRHGHRPPASFFHIFRVLHLFLYHRKDPQRAKPGQHRRRAACKGQRFKPLLIQRHLLRPERGHGQQNHKEKQPPHKKGGKLADSASHFHPSQRQIKSQSRRRQRHQPEISLGYQIRHGNPAAQIHHQGAVIQKIQDPQDIDAACRQAPQPFFQTTVIAALPASSFPQDQVSHLQHQKSPRQQPRQGAAASRPAGRRRKQQKHFPHPVRQQQGLQLPGRNFMIFRKHPALPSPVSFCFRPAAAPLFWHTPAGGPFSA